MNLNNFSNPSGELKDGQNGKYKYFLPNVPPTELEYDNETAQLLSIAERNVGKLSGIGYLLPNPHLLIKPYIRKEAVLSSRIEGTQASLSDVFKNEAGEIEIDESKDVKEVINYVRALEYGLDKISNSDIDINLIKEMHGILLKDVRGENRNPGNFRDRQNWIGTKGTSIGESTYVPPAPEELSICLKNFIEYLRKDDMPLLVQTALMHYYFESIHPFRDGNGRIGRLLITLFLCKRNVLSQPLLYLSAFFNDNRQEYYKRLLEISQKSQYISWIKFFLKGVIKQSDDALNRAKKLSNLRETYHKKIRDEGLVQNITRVADNLFENPYITIPRVRDQLDISYPTAKRYVNSLEDMNIINEITGRQRNKLYKAPKILDILESI